ncbi:putative membrane protein [Bacillus methanolicus MGA3]|uniref:Putative membrane protein n=1 Tax=Bacillus methanolicus (strain MGA3 / ATCC 53907) TaxID=796606 RepID=A0A068M033_BACMM|nr:putative membrane protein [Bacillus methanolicus MGA3]
MHLRKNANLILANFLVFLDALGLIKFTFHHSLMAFHQAVLLSCYFNFHIRVGSKNWEGEYQHGGTNNTKLAEKTCGPYP